MSIQLDSIQLDSIQLDLAVLVTNEYDLQIDEPNHSVPSDTVKTESKSKFNLIHLIQLSQRCEARRGEAANRLRLMD